MIQIRTIIFCFFGGTFVVYSKRYIVSDDDVIVIDDTPDQFEEPTNLMKHIKQELGGENIDFTSDEVQAFIRMKRAGSRAVAHLQGVSFPLEFFFWFCLWSGYVCVFDVKRDTY